VSEGELTMEFLVEFDLNVPDGVAAGEADARKQAESSAAARLAQEGHLARLWTLPAGASDSKAVGLYRAESRAQLDALLGALPLADWMRITVTALEPHPNDAVPARPAAAGGGLPDPRLTFVYRLEASVGEPLELGEVNGGRRRIVPLTGGTVSGPQVNGRLVAGVSADWQVIGPDGTVAGDVRYAIATGDGDLLYVRSQGIRHGSEEVLARLGRGEAVGAGEYTFRTAVAIETAAPALDWLNKGIFVAVAGRLAGAVIYDTYLVA
jgi:muconolactone delta-isomerase